MTIFFDEVNQLFCLIDSLVNQNIRTSFLTDCSWWGQANYAIIVSEHFNAKCLQNSVYANRRICRDRLYTNKQCSNYDQHWITMAQNSQLLCTQNPNFKNSESDFQWKNNSTHFLWISMNMISRAATVREELWCTIQQRLANIRKLFVPILCSCIPRQACNIDKPVI